MDPSTLRFPAAPPLRLPAEEAEPAWPSLRRPANLPAPAPFPLDALPRVMADYAEAVAAALPCPTDLVAVAALASAASAIGNSHSLEVKAGWIEGPRLWCAIVCDPGAKKSPALAAATAPLRKAQRDYQRAYLTSLEQDAIVQAGAPSLPGRRRPPVMQQVFTADTTREGLTTLLENNPRGIALIADELAGWALSLNQYKQGRGDDRQFWLALWGGAEILVNRARDRQRPTAYVTQPMLTVLGCLPPAALTHLQDEAAREDGFVHRVLFSWPERVPSGWTDTEPSATACAAYHELFDRLLALEVPASRPSGEVSPRRLGWTPDGKRAWIEYVGRLAADLNNPDHPEPLRGHWAKLEGYGARLALVLHVCRHVLGETASPDVDETSMRAAVRLVEYFQAHARRIHAWFLDQSAGSSKDYQAILDWLRRHRTELGESGRFSWRRIRRDLHNRFASRDHELRRALHLLEEHGYLKEVRRPRPQRGRPPEPEYWINPALCL